MSVECTAGCFLRVTRVLAARLVLAVALAACSAGAELEVATDLRPPLDSSMARFRVLAGSQVWQLDGSTFRSTLQYGLPHAGPFDTPSRGDLQVAFALLAAGDTISSGAVTVQLHSDWRWGFLLSADTANPTRYCFGCVGGRAFALDSPFRRFPADSVWLTWGGNSIRNPVVY